MFIGMGFLHKTKNCAYSKKKEKSWLVSWKGSSHYLKKRSHILYKSGVPSLLSTLGRLFFPYIIWKVKRDVVQQSGSEL